MAETKAPATDDSKRRAGLVFHMVSKNRLKPGDHIYAYRFPIPYAHHGIYIGEPDTEVIHFCGPKGGKKKDVTIRSCTLEEFMGVSVFIHLVAYDASPLATFTKTTLSYNQRKSRPAEEVIEKAKYYLEHPEEYTKYNLFRNNCETFVIYCKVGRAGFKSIPILSVLDDCAAWADNARPQSPRRDTQ